MEETSIRKSNRRNWQAEETVEWEPTNNWQQGRIWAQLSSDQNELLHEKAYITPRVSQLYFVNKSACRVSCSPSLFSLDVISTWYRLVLSTDPGQQMKHQHLSSYSYVLPFFCGGSRNKLVGYAPLDKTNYLWGVIILSEKVGWLVWVLGVNLFFSFLSRHTTAYDV